MSDPLIMANPDDAWGLNMVSSIYIKEVGKINESLVKLANEKAQDTRLGAEALFGVAGNVMLEETIRAGTSLAAGAGGIYADSEASSIESSCNSTIKSIDKQLGEKNEQLKTEQNPKFKDALSKELDQLNSEKTRSNNKIQNAHTNATMKMQTLTSASNGVGGMFEGMAKSSQQIGNSNKGIFDAQQHQDDQSIQVTLSVLNGFTSTDYFEGLKTVSNIHLVA